MAVTVYRQVKVANGSRRYVRINLGRGRRPADLSGPYYLRYFCTSWDRRVWEHAGDDLTEAIRLSGEKERLLQAKAAGVPVVESNKDDGRLRIDAAVEEYFSNLAAQGKDPKTIGAYRVALEQFRQSCPKVYVDEVKKQDLLNFMTWLRRQPRKPRKSGDPNRTFFNKTGHVVVFLKAYGVSRILKKSEYPRFNPKPVVYYSTDQVKALYADAKDDEERYLKTPSVWCRTLKLGQSVVMIFTVQCDRNHSHVQVHGIASSCHREFQIQIRCLAFAGGDAWGSLSSDGTVLEHWSTGPTGSHRPCLPDCPKMAGMTKGPQLSARHQDSGCCQIAPARPTQESQGFVPAGIEIGTPVIQSTNTANVSRARSAIAFDSNPGLTARFSLRSPSSAHF